MFESPSASTQLLENKSETDVLTTPQNEGQEALISATQPTKNKVYARKQVLAVIVLVVIIVVFLVVFLPVFFLVVDKNSGSRKSIPGASAVGGGKVPNPNSPSGAISGGDGSIIKLDNGTEFTYRNPFGGIWVQDPANPFNNDARPNSWTPPLNTSWQWGKDRIYGVNLGGWLVTEPFIAPALYQKYPTAVDEFTLSQAMAADTADGGLGQLEDHYKTFITELDIAQIAGAGLNFIRVPLPFWAIETWDGEPYLAKTSWTYFLQLLNWARKYGLRVCLDLHTVPGSQNGDNHSGRLAPVGFLAGNLGLATAQRTLYYIRVLTEFISQPEYQNLVPLFGIVNEPLIGEIGMDVITSFNLEAHDIIRNITGLGEGNGPYIVIHDGFQPLSDFNNYLQGSDRVILDTHPYFSFGGISLAPIGVDGDDGLPGGEWPLNARMNFGVTLAGEFSASPNNCGLFLVGVGQNSTDPQCPEYDDWTNYNCTMKQGIQNFVMASMDALGDWFFWTWKVGPAQSGVVETPGWSYQLGLENGWIPTDPRTAFGMCGALGASLQPFNGSYQPWQTGTPSSIPASSTSQFPWRPTTISSASVPVDLLPTYTDTASIITMPPATFTQAPASVTKAADGWFNTKDTIGGITSVSGCPYPSEYDATFTVVPTAPCTGPGSVATAA
ncbi:glycoside hydrolase family 5 protein [Gymnopilus junonius]|uniref:glucan 1,3-beta-glucosidase n=1 Tax=Gymnopilus junonius TaxID=109634 RepID=A0A9P5TQ27_GYMJU|nr:glycoside hydrolase family 5 protein [Gymnopilus junonius]